MLVVFLITGVFILLGILYIFHLKREIRRIIEWIEHNEHIYSVNVLDKDIENLALTFFAIWSTVSSIAVRAGFFR